MENIIIGLIFIGAVAYLGKQLLSHFNPKNIGCAKGCGGACNIPNFDLTDLSEIKMKKNDSK